MSLDTSTEAIQKWLEKERRHAETLRAIPNKNGAGDLALRMVESDIAWVEALAAERDALQSALRDVASFLSDLDGAERYLKRISDMRPAMEHAAMLAASPFAVKRDE